MGILEQIKAHFVVMPGASSSFVMREERPATLEVAQPVVHDNG
jgi:hypothetical protein